MYDVIVEKLKELERAEGIRILHAAESGSRAWGFASPDSDYDVRFINMRDKDFYLRLDRTRDVIELPISDLLDMNGWDLDKTLRLLHGSNPTLFEWFSSPIVYVKTDFYDRLLPLLREYFTPEKGLYHYLSMAKGNYREYLQTDLVKAKKYFYVLRPILACRWILERRSPPPMLFRELAEAELEPSLTPEVERLLDIKMNVPELKLIPRADRINEYIESSLTEIEATVMALPRSPHKSWDGLNGFFLRECGGI